jgi:hypothetical protein
MLRRERAQPDRRTGSGFSLLGLVAGAGVSLHQKCASAPAVAHV